MLVFLRPSIFWSIDMNFINLVFFLIVAGIFQRFFRIALDKSFSKNPLHLQ